MSTAIAPKGAKEPETHDLRHVNLATVQLN